MPKVDFRSPRLYVDASLATDATLALDRAQANYLGNVLRLGAGDPVLIFNGRDGEWQAAIGAGKRADKLVVLSQTRPQIDVPDLVYLFAPLKHARLDYMVQKAVEMGVSSLQPVITRFTQISRLNTDRMHANAIEAAEQCGIISVPSVHAPIAMQKYLDGRDSARLLIFCDEGADVSDPVAALAAARTDKPVGIDVLIGPEGGFAAEEREVLLRLPNIVRLPLGPRILRADTAAVAALALVQTVLGDWAAARSQS